MEKTCKKYKHSRKRSILMSKELIYKRYWKCCLFAMMQVWQHFKRFENMFYGHMFFPTLACHLLCDFFFKLVNNASICTSDASHSVFLREYNMYAGVGSRQTIVFFYPKIFHFWSKSQFLFFGSQSYSAILVHASDPNFFPINRWSIKSVFKNWFFFSISRNSILDFWTIHDRKIDFWITFQKSFKINHIF